MQSLGDQVAHLACRIGPDGRKEKRQRGQALLTIDNIGLRRITLDEHDTAQEVGGHVSHRPWVGLNEAQQILDQFLRLLVDPRIRSLVVGC